MRLRRSSIFRGTGDGAAGGGGHIVCIHKSKGLEDLDECKIIMSAMMCLRRVEAHYDILPRCDHVDMSNSRLWTITSVEALMDMRSVAEERGGENKS